MPSPGSQPSPPRREGPSAETALLASALSALALVLFAIYLISVVGQVVPLRMASPAWQLRFSQGAIAPAPLALIGLGLLLLAAYVDPGNGALAARRRTLSAFAGLAVAGFLLLIPLQLYAASSSIQAMNTGQVAKTKQVDKNLTLLRQQINAAASLEDLQARIQAIQAPDLILNAATLGQPLPQIKKALLASVDRSERHLNQAIGGDSPRRLWAVLQRSVQGLLNSLALALGFAALAQRSGSDLSLLQELQSHWQRLQLSRSARRSSTSDADYLRQLSEDGEQE